MVWGSLVANVSAKVLLVIKMRKMQQFKNAKYARMRGMITTAKSREGQGREGKAEQWGEVRAGVDTQENVPTWLGLKGLCCG